MIDFLGIGAQKAGTTWLYRQLESHPDIAFPGGKELHFWDQNPAADAAGYLALFPEAREELRQGEITPAYATLSQPTIRTLREAAPALRLIFILRNPVERAWSSALMALGRAELSFEEASDQWFLDHFRSAGSRTRGAYETTLRRWRAEYPAEQLLILRYEDIVHQPRAVLAACATHLRVNSEPFDSLGDEALSHRVFAGPGFAIRPSLRRELQHQYGPELHSLERYLEWDLSAWHDEDGTTT